MPYSYVLLPGDGTTTNFSFNFGYLAKAHIHASVDTVETSFDWVGDFSIQITPAPAAGTVIEIRRRTPLDEPIVDWTDGTVLNAGDMDLNTLFALFAAQEAQDGVDASVSQNAEGVWDGQGRTTTNFADPEDSTGLVTKGYFDDVYTPQLDQKIADANAAIDTKVTEATTQASNAASSATTAQGYAVAADSSADLAAALLAIFKGQYLGALAEPPTVDGNGNPITEGDLYFDTTLKMMKVYSGTAWVNAGSTVEGVVDIPNTTVVATEGQTTIPVPNGYDPGMILVVLNGLTVWPPEVDASNGTDIIFTTPLSAGDEVTWVAFGAFEVANAIPAAGSVTDEKVSASAGIQSSKISHTSNLVGASQRSLEAYLQDRVSVKDFGAVGDGSVDDTAAIQAAVDSAAKVVFFPSGTYKTTAPINITTSGKTLIGETNGRQRAVSIEGNIVGNIFHVTATALATFENLGITQNGTGSCIRLNDGEAHVVRNCAFTSSLSSNNEPMIYFRGSNTYIENNSMTNYMADGYCIVCDRTAGLININSAIRQNYMGGPGQGIWVGASGGAPRPEGVSIIDNVFLTTGPYQLVVKQVLSLRVIGNMFDQGKAACIYMDPTGFNIDGVHIEANYISTAQNMTGPGGGVAVHVNSAASGVASGLMIVGNDIQFSAYGIALGPKTNYASIIGNSFGSIDQTAIGVSSAKNTTTIGNTVRNGSMTNIDVSDSGGGGPHIINGNHFSPSGTINRVISDPNKVSWANNFGLKTSGFGTAVTAASGTSVYVSVPHGLKYTPDKRKVIATAVAETGGYIDVSAFVQSVDATNVVVQVFYGVVSAGTIRVNIFAEI